MNDFFRFNILLWVCLFLSACSNWGEEAGIGRKNTIVLKETEEKISLAIQNLSHAELTEKARFIRSSDAAFTEAGLSGEVAVDWVGPLEPLVADIAKVSGLSFKVMGQAPGMPIYITTVHDRVGIGELLREIHFQAKDRADLVFYAGQKVIELRYREIG